MNVMVVSCHPLAESFTQVAAAKAMSALTKAGHRVDHLDLHAEGFEPGLTAVERIAHHADVSEKPWIADHAKRLQSADSLVLVYPTWWSGQPAMLKGWFDRVWTTGVAYYLPEGSPRIRGLLKFKSITAITTHGSTKLVNMIEGEVGKRMLSRQIRPMCGWRCRFNWVALYGIDNCSDTERAAFLARVEAVSARL